MKRMLGLMFILVISAIPVGTDAITIVDSLGTAAPSTQFSVFGTGGCANSIGSTQFVGPEFTLTQPTVITEIGGFFVNCGFILGVPQCPEIAQFVVQIRPSTNGVPDPSIILASYPLSRNDNVFVATYQSVSIDLPLGAGTYFALFAPLQEDMAGYVVGSATDPFLYQAGLVPWGALNLSTGASIFEGLCNDAVRILGTPVVPFAAFTAELDLELGPRRDDAFELQSTFTLGTSSNGIDLSKDDVTLELKHGTGSFTTTIPAGSFQQDKKGSFEFEGTINGVELEATMTLRGNHAYKFKAEGKHADLTGIAKLVTVTLTIGNDSGSTTVRAKIDHDDSDHGDREDRQHEHRTAR
jgi:hypothetical protein